MSRKNSGFRYYEPGYLGKNGDDKIDIDRILGAISGTQDPLHFPVSYPAIDFDPATKKTILQAAGFIAAGIVLSGLLRGAVSK